MRIEEVLRRITISEMREDPAHESDRAAVTKVGRAIGLAASRIRDHWISRFLGEQL